MRKRKSEKEGERKRESNEREYSAASFCSLSLSLSFSLSLSLASFPVRQREEREQGMRAREERRICGIKDANARAGHQNLINQRKNEPGRKPKRSEEEKGEIGGARARRFSLVRRCQRPVRFALMHMPRLLHPLLPSYLLLPLCSVAFNSSIRTCEWGGERTRARKSP